MATLTERIQQQRTEQREPPRVVDLRPVPMWRRRIEIARAKDLTPFFIDGAMVPSGSERGA